jgi:uncharacterized protein YrrD
VDNSQTTRKWSELKGIAVVSLADGRKVGTCDDFYFEPDTQRVYALRIKTGLLSHKFLPAANISAIGNDAITTPDEELLLKELADERKATIVSGENLGNYRVMSVSGTIVGTIGSVLLDTSTPNEPHLATFELTGGLLERLGGRYPSFAAAQVVRYGQDVLIIPDEVAQSLHR